MTRKSIVSLIQPSLDVILGQPSKTQLERFCDIPSNVPPLFWTLALKFFLPYFFPPILTPFFLL